jgi:hypothetical protein
MTNAYDCGFRIVDFGLPNPQSAIRNPQCTAGDRARAAQRAEAVP